MESIFRSLIAALPFGFALYAYTVPFTTEWWALLGAAFWWRCVAA